MSIGAAIGIEAANMALDYGFNLLTRKQQMRDQKELIDYQQDKQIDFWNMQNAYNDPSAQVSRLRAAGLNPAMLNGNSVNNTAGGLSSIGAPSAPSGSSRQASIGSSMQMLSQLLSDEKARGFMDAQIIKLGEEVLNLQIERDIKQIAKAMGMTESEVRGLERTALYEAYYGVGLDGGEPTIRNNPYVKQMEEVDARTRASDSQKALNDALRTTEDMLRSARLTNLNASSTELQERANLARTQNSEVSERIRSMSRENALQEAYVTIGRFFGLETISNLPPAVIAKASEYYRDFINGEYTYQSTIDAFYRIINAYNERAIHITTSVSDAETATLSAFGFGASHSYSVSESH